MKWITVGSAHWNTDLIQAFSWSAGRLLVWWQGVTEKEGPEIYTDPDGAMYNQLCLRIGVRPLEVGPGGKG